MTRTRRGIRRAAGGRTDLPVGTHAHQNWAFDRPGDYRLTFEASGRLAEDGSRVSSGRVTLAYQVQR